MVKFNENWEEELKNYPNKIEKNIKQSFGETEDIDLNKAASSKNKVENTEDKQEFTQNNLKKGIGLGKLSFEKGYSKSGVYSDNPQNRKLGRVGKPYQSKKRKEPKVDKKEDMGNKKDTYEKLKHNPKLTYEEAKILLNKVGTMEHLGTEHNKKMMKKVIDDVLKKLREERDKKEGK